MSRESAATLPADIMPQSRNERLATLFDTHEDRLYRLARRLTASADDANDLVQETFLKAAACLNAVPTAVGKEEAWLVRVLVNLRRDQWRKAAVRRRSASLLRASEPLGPSDVETAFITKRAVWRALDALHPRRRAIMIMHELEGLSSAMIASVLGVTTVTVGWHLSMGRRELKRLLKSYIGDNA